jgi:5-formyltetrahydrofolate cyclo-ligase
MERRAVKARLRAERLAARDALSPVERGEKSLAIASHGSAVIRPVRGHVVSAFLPIRTEVDVRLLMDRLRFNEALLCVPAVIDKQLMVFRRWEPETELVPGSFGTLGPGPDVPEVDPDIMLVPLAAFDKHGQRIGYGGGYYDRAIERLHQKGLNPRLIGIAFECQEVASVPAEPHDIRLHAVLTESGYRAFTDEAAAKIR